MKFEPKSAETRQWLIEVTAPIFNRKGYAGTAISDLTEATGMTKGAIYGNFENKEEIALCAFDYNLAERVRIIRNEQDKYPTWREKLLVYAFVFRPSKKVPFPEGGCPMLNTGTDANDTNEPLRLKAAEALEQWRKTIEDMLHKGIAAGEFRDDTPVRKIAATIIALSEGSIFWADATRKNKDAELVMDMLADVINGISV